MNECRGTGRPRRVERTAGGCAAAGIEAGIERSVGVDPGHVSSGDSVPTGEAAADEQFPVGLHGDAGDVAALIDARLKAGIHPAGGLNTRSLGAKSAKGPGPQERRQPPSRREGPLP